MGDPLFETVFTDLSNSVENVVTGSEMTVLAIIGVIALAQGLTMPSLSNIFGRAAQGVIVLAVVLFLWDVLDSEQRFEWANWEAESLESWRELLALTVRTLLGYYVVMFIAIGVVSLVKGIVRR